MKILIVYYSNTGNTKKVADLLNEKLTSVHDVKIKNALTASTELVDWANVLIIGSPIHGFILFGQKFCTQVNIFMKKVLPANLQGKKVLLFATYLFSPGKGLKKAEQSITLKNGAVVGKHALKRNQKAELVNQIYESLLKIKV